MKDTFSLPNIGKGVVITKWKELTLFLPSEIKTFPSKDFSPFTVEFLGNKIDHGELPHNIFQENILNSALGVMLKTIENLPVCPGIYDQALVDMAGKKKAANLYFVDAKGANVDGEIVKCIRSLNCTYKLPVHSKTRCNKRQDSLRSCFMFFVTLDEPTESEKHAMQTKSYISDAFDYSHEFQMVKTQDLWEYREFDRSLMPKAGNNHDHLEQVRRFILKNGFQEPIIISCDLTTGKAYITEGNHRLWVVIQEGIPFIPCRVIPHWPPPMALTKSLKLICPL